MEHIRPDIMELIVRQLQGQLSQPEEKLLGHWLQENPQNQADFEELVKIWATSGKAEIFSPDTELAWKKVKAKTLDKVNQSYAGKSVLWTSWIWKVAASVILLIGIGLALLYFRKKEEKWSSVASFSEKKKFTLPDSSKVWLNRNSSIRYTDFEGKTRLVKLQGEAFFEITHNPQKPFQIEGKASLTEVLGTSFRLYSPASGADKVEVATGLVSFSALKHPDQKIFVKPGKKAEVKPDGRLKTGNIQDGNFAALKSERLIFENTPLPEVCQQLEVYFGKKVEIGNENLKRCRFTGNFEKPALEEVLRVIEVSIGLDASSEVNSIKLTGMGCP